MCRNENERCQEWANAGECVKNPAYMLTSCGGSCGTCNTTHQVPVWKGPDWQLYEVNSIHHDLITHLDQITKGGMYTIFEGGAVYNDFILFLTPFFFIFF